MFSKTDIEKYFLTEKSGGLLFIFIGSASVILAIVLFFFIKNNWNKGAAVPFFVFGIMQLAAGYTIYNRADTQRQQNVYAFDMAPSSIKIKEIPRLEKVNKQFILLLYVEIALMIIGIGLILYFKKDTDRYFWVGFGWALLIQAAICLGTDYFAAARAKIYTRGLKEFTLNL